MEKIRLSRNEAGIGSWQHGGSTVISKRKWSARWPVKDCSIAEVAKSYDLVPQTVRGFRSRNVEKTTRSPWMPRRALSSRRRTAGIQRLPRHLRAPKGPRRPATTGYQHLPGTRPTPACGPWAWKPPGDGRKSASQSPPRTWSRARTWPSGISRPMSLG